MTDFGYSLHARQMLVERQISEGWVERTVNSPDRTIRTADGNTHYLKAIDENEGRILRVVVNPSVEPARVVTLFFDRRYRGKI